MNQTVADVPGPNDQQKAVLDHLWARRFGLIYKARLSVLYHLKRARFFDRWDKICSIATTLSATAAAVTLLQAVPVFDKCLALLTAALSLVPLIYNPGQHARHHAELVGRFRTVLAQMERVGEQWPAELCNQFAADLVEIEAAEPAPLGALAAECQNQLGLAFPEDQRGAVVHLKWHHRLFKHWIDFDAQKLAGQG